MNSKPNSTASDSASRSTTLLALCILALASAAPFTGFAAHNAHRVYSLQLLVLYAALVFASGVVAALAGCVLLKQPLWKCFVFTAVLVLCFFWFGGLRDAIASVVKIRFLVWIAWCSVTGLLLYLLSIVLRDERRVVLPLVFVLCLNVLPASAAAFQFFTRAESADRSRIHRVSSLSISPNFAVTPPVFFLMLDGYGRKDILSKVIGFDNAPFLANLEKRNFTIANDSTSNYPWTDTSLSSILEMEYHPETTWSAMLDAGMYSAALLGDNATVRAFKAAGYEYALAPSGVWSKVSCGHEEDRCLNSNRPHDMEMALMQMTPVYHFGKLRDHLLGEHYLEPRDLRDKLATLPDKVFFFAHFPGVHDQINPRSCDTQERGGNFINDRRTAEQYSRSVDCLNGGLIELVDEIIAKWPDAVIVVQSDHGPMIKRPVDGAVEDQLLWRVGAADRFQERYGTISALRLPAACRSMVAHDMSAVNVFRVVFSCLQGRSLQPVASKWFYPDLLTNRVTEVNVGTRSR